MHDPSTASASVETLLSGLSYRLTNADRSLLRALDSGQREQLRLRLAALALLEERGDCAEACHVAGLSEGSLTKLRACWTVDPRLDSIIALDVLETPAKSSVPGPETASRSSRRMVKLDPAVLASIREMSEEALLAQLEHQLTTSDRAMLDRLDVEQREGLRLRLAAIVAAETGAANDQAAQMAKMSEQSMFRLRRTWKMERDFSRIAGIFARPKRGVAKGPEYEKARKIAGKLVNRPKMAALPLKSFAREIVKRVNGEIAIDGAASIAREVRRKYRLTPNALKENYGREVILDATAASMSLLATSGEPRIAVLALVVEAATGLVLSARVATEAGAGQAQTSALAEACVFLARRRADVPRAEPTRIHAVIAPAADPESATLAERLKPLIGENFVEDAAVRRFGRRTIASIGPVLGDLRLLPGSTDGGRASRAGMRVLGRTPIDVELAQAVVNSIVAKHNEPILHRLRILGIIPPVNADFARGAMYVALAKTLARPEVN